MEEREPLTQLPNCQNPICAMEKKVLEDMLQTKRIECQGNCAMELKELKEEMAKLKRYMHDLVSKKQEKEKVIVISPSYSVRSINVDKEGAYRTLIDRTRIVEEQLTDILRSLEETEKRDHNNMEEQLTDILCSLEETEKPDHNKEGGSSEDHRNLPQMQETEPEGQNGTHEQEHVAEVSRIVLDESVMVEKENMAPRSDPCKGEGLVLGVSEQENQEQLQVSEVEEHEHIEVVSDIVELARDCEVENGDVELPDADESPQQDPETEHALVCVELPNLEKSPQQDSEMEHALVCVELPNLEKSPRQGLHIEQLDSVELPNTENVPQQDSNIQRALVCVELPNLEKSPQQDSEMEHALVCVELPNLEKAPQQDSHIEQLDSVELPNTEDFPQQDSNLEQALVCVELPNLENAPQQDLNVEYIMSNPLCLPMNLECSLDIQHLRPHQVQQLDDPVQGQLVEYETPVQQHKMRLRPRRQRLSKPDLPELPWPGQPEEVRISKMVEELVLEQQQSSHEMVIGQPARTVSPRKRPTPKTSQKGASSTRKGSKGKSNSDTASNLSLEEQQRLSEGQSKRKQTKRKLGDLWTPEKEQKQGKQMGKTKKTKLDSKPKKQEQPKQKGRTGKSKHDNKPKKQLKCQEPRRLFSDTTVSTVTPSDEQDEGGASQGSPKQNSNASFMSQEEQQASKTPDEAMPTAPEPDSEAAVKIHLPSNDQQEGKNKHGKLRAKVLTEWLARQGLLEGQKRSEKA